MGENRCVCCGEIIPEGTLVCVNCTKFNENLVTPEFICEQLASVFNWPCRLPPFEKDLHDTWCNRFCGKVIASDCWMHYFQLKYKERESRRKWRRKYF